MEGCSLREARTGGPRRKMKAGGRIKACTKNVQGREETGTGTRSRKKVNDDETPFYEISHSWRAHLEAHLELTSPQH